MYPAVYANGTLTTIDVGAHEVVATDDDLLAVDGKRRYRMDDKTFDSLLKLSVTRTGRRRLLQAAAAVGIGGFLTRGSAAAQDAVVTACQTRGSTCRRNRQCACRNRANIICDPLPAGCKNGTRCCGVGGAACGGDCDCCRGYRCKATAAGRKCVRT